MWGSPIFKECSLMSINTAEDIINWKAYAETRALMGPGFVRILGYFREDGMKSVAAIEQAFRDLDSAKLVMPAHTLKGEAWQFGAEKLGELAEEIEIAARHYVEIRQDPSDLVRQVASLRVLFETTLSALDADVSPLVNRRDAVPTNRFGLGLTA
jgi:histidine phosphotransfer protein HptB